MNGAFSRARARTVCGHLGSLGNLARIYSQQIKTANNAKVAKVAKGFTVAALLMEGQDVGERYQLVIEDTGPSAMVALRLRSALKVLLRRFGFRCVSISQESTNGDLTNDSGK